MKRIVLFCIVINILSCTNNINNSKFKSIDYSTDNGDRGDFSLKIDSMNNIFIKGGDIFEGKYMLATKLSDEIIDSINKIISKINFTIVDTCYTFVNCQFCNYYKLIVKQNGMKFKTAVGYEINNNIQELKYVNELTVFLDYIHNRLFEKSKNIVFETNPENIYFPPPPLKKHD